MVLSGVNMHLLDEKDKMELRVIAQKAISSIDLVNLRLLQSKEVLTDRETVLFNSLHLIMTQKPGGSSMWANMKRFHLSDTGFFIDKLARMPAGTKYSSNAVAEAL